MTISSVKTGTIGDSLLAGNASFIPTSYESIATLNGDGSTASITFSSIPSTYKHLQIRANFITNVAGNSVSWRANGDTASNYADHTLSGSGTVASANYSVPATSAQFFGAQSGTSTTYPNVVIFELIDYASTTKYKTARIFAGVDENGSGEVALFSGLWMSTSAVNSLTIRMSSSFFKTSSTFSLYGIKGA